MLEETYKLPYEKKYRSQHGEDGIIETMLDAIKVKRDHKFLEIGWGDGGTNMTAHLLVNKNFSGVGVDAKPAKPGALKYPVTHYQEYVTPSSVKKYLKDVPLDCDFFSLDIDSFDYDVARELLKNGFRPKTVCVEVNQRFGSKEVASFPYIDHPKIYHKLTFNGCSIEKYRRLWAHYGYKYFGVDSSVTNAFFYREDCCNDLSGIEILSDEYVGTENIIRTKWFEKNQTPKEKFSRLLNFWMDKQHLIFTQDLGI